MNSHSTEKELQQFGFILGGIIVAMFGLVFPWMKHDFDFSFWPLWPWLVAVPLATLAVAAPKYLKPVFVVWTKIGHVLGFINSRIILGVLFFCVFTPIAIVWKVIRKDPMARHLELGKKSYRIKRNSDILASHMENPY